jgi:hypothetical protein
VCAAFRGHYSYRWRNVVQVERVTESGDVVRLRLARQFAGRWAYYLTAAYWVDGLLIETS